MPVFIQSHTLNTYHATLHKMCSLISQTQPSLLYFPSLWMLVWVSHHPPLLSPTPYHQGQDFVSADFLRPSSPLASLPEAAKTIIHVDNFSIDYRPDGQVAQFYSTLSVKAEDGSIISTKTISVNDPLRYKGITMYQVIFLKLKLKFETH
jgi:hypothetical protein